MVVNKKGNEKRFFATHCTLQSYSYTIRVPHPDVRQDCINAVDALWMELYRGLVQVKTKA